MNSGAGHDSMIFADYVPTAMFFVPCRRGVSHNPEEYVEPDALAKGTRLLYESIIAIDKMKL
jgi:allantoate deiminase